MSDNVNISEGAGRKIASDQATYSGDTADIQLVRAVSVTGAEGSKTVVEPTFGAGAVTTGTPRGTLASDDPAVVALQIIDDWDETDRAKVNPIAGQAGVAGGSGVVSATTQRMTLATDVALPAGENVVGAVVGKNVTINASFTRPADTTTYAAGDAVTNSTSSPTVITFTNCARANAGGGFIVGADMIDSANQTLKGQFELWLFDTTVTPDNDNAVFTPTDAELATLVAIIQFNAAFVGDATAGAGGNVLLAGTIAGAGSKAFTCGASSRDLFGLVVVRNAYVPTSSEILTLRLHISQN